MTETPIFDQLEGLRQGETKAWRAFVTHFAPRLFRYFHSVLFNEQEAEDLVSETLAAVLSQVAHFREESSLETWVFRIGRNKLYDRHIRFRRIDHFLKRYMPFLHSFPPANQDPEGALLLRDNLEEVACALQTLPVRYREVLGLRFIEDLSIKEVASIMGLSEFKVKNDTRDGRKLLQKRINNSQASTLAFQFSTPQEGQEHD